jgi:ADP-L-glycero-D-manno-heptose 6-epimerase
MKKKVLITGGAGFIGSSIAWELQSNYPDIEITIFDKFNDRSKRENGNFKYLGDFKNLIGIKAEVITGDLANEIDIKKLLKNKYDVIYHQGAISDTTAFDQSEVLKINSDSFKYFVDYCITSNCKLIYASSAGTYGNSQSPNRVGFGEHPENIYGFSKLQMDEISRAYLKSNNSLHIVGLRYFNVYGPGELFKRKTSSMILQLARQAIQNKSVRLFKHGEQSRDFVFIKDVVQANILAINGDSGIYNIGSGENRTFNDIIKILEINLNKKILVDYFENPYSFYQNNTVADLSLSESGLGYSPKYTLEVGIQEYLKEIINYSINEWRSFDE